MNTTSDDDFIEDDEEVTIISKSQLKRESQALQALGEELVRLPPQKLSTIPLPDNLAEAIRMARTIKAHGGFKRQLQYIGKLMRQIDADPIEQAMQEIRESSVQATAKLHRLEQWRERLIDEGDDALAKLLDEHPGADRQRLRQLIRNAQKEKQLNKPPKAARELFRYLRELLND